MPHLVFGGFPLSNGIPQHHETGTDLQQLLYTLYFLVFTDCSVVGAHALQCLRLAIHSDVRAKSSCEYIYIYILKSKREDDIYINKIYRSGGRIVTFQMGI